MNYKKLNVYLGWLVFLISTTVYFLTIEDTVSLWDCGEYITAAYKLEVGHPPGAPLFMLLGRLFSFFSDPADVAVWINRMSALSSSASILFMFWSITMLTKKMALQQGRTLSKGSIIAILGSGFIGSMAYTFTDSFWFSAVEGEVYAMSSLFTALIFWAILKWDEEMEALKHGELDDRHVPMRWMILIMFLFGLAIGVHLLGLLAVPAIAYIIYFNQWKKFSWKGFFVTGILSIFILGFIQEGIIPGTISLASKFEVAFVNSFGLPFYVGSIFFFALLVIGCIFLYRWSKRNHKVVVNAAALGFIVFLIGYGSFATIVIRSQANTPLDENDPENLVTLHAYLKREQYGSWPILSGPYWNSAMDEDQESWGDRSRFYARRFVVTQGGTDVKAFRSESRAIAYAKTLGTVSDVTEKYFVTNEDSRKNQEPTYVQTTFFPRMYWNQDPSKIAEYKRWSGYDDNSDVVSTDIGTDGKRIPTFGENLTYFANYQVNWMYWRYFMWNFAGRQNDIQGHGDALRGNWISGISAIDDARLGDQANAPTFTTENPAHNTFFFLPLIIGLIGMCFHFYRAPKDAFVVMLTFIFTGLAIVIYLNQKPLEPRERDYAYAASFYAFAMWIGIGVFALFEAFKSFKKKEYKGFGMIVGCGLLLMLIFDTIFSTGFIISMSWLVISLLAAILVFGMSFLGKSLKNEVSGAALSILLTLIVPILLAVQGWDDHDRSNKSSARDLAYNYLQSCTKNSILFTNGDNDTFPLWYLQEVEEERTDVRVCNLSLMQTDWYTEQMMMKAYDSDPLPIKFTEDQIMMFAGNTDQVYFLSMVDMVDRLPKEQLKTLFDIKVKNNRQAFISSFNQFRTGSAGVAQALTAKDPTAQATLTAIQTSFSKPITEPTFEDVVKMINDGIEMLSGYSSGMMEGPEQAIQQFNQSLRDWERPWDYLPLGVAMEFVRNDNNMIDNNGRKLRVFPSTGFILPVNKDNAVKSGLITKEEKNKAEKEIRFRIDKQAITREQVMMLDILVNNDWKRNIYFSSPGGCDVSIALYTSGYVKQNGMAFEVTPLRDQEIISKEKMYHNLMKVYQYGKMNQKGVLTDYYTRRHTSQYRDHFSRLADAYLRDAENESNRKMSAGMQIKGLRAQGNNRLADSLQNSLKGADERIASCKSKAIKLINKSLTVMPVERVIDYGEPQAQGERDRFDAGNEVTYQSYSDGILHDYVGVLYRAGDRAGAEKLGAKVASHLESVFRYYENSPAKFARNNKMDLISALNNYMLLATYSADKEKGNPNGALSKRTNMEINRLYKTVFPKLYKELEDEAIEAGESVRPGSTDELAKALFDLKGHIDAVGMRYGYIEKPKPTNPQPMGGGDGQLTQEQFQKMMEAQGQ